MDETCDNMLCYATTSYLQAYIWYLLLYMYTVTTKLAHRLYYDATVVDYNLIINLFIIGDVKYQAHARLCVNWDS